MKLIAITTAIALVSGLTIANPVNAKVVLFPPGSGLCTTVTRPDGVIVTTCPKAMEPPKTQAKQPEGCYPIGKKRLTFNPPDGDAPKRTIGGGSHGPTSPKRK